jgi:uncharacterized membrane protein
MRFDRIVAKHNEEYKKMLVNTVHLLCLLTSYQFTLEESIGLIMTPFMNDPLVFQRPLLKLSQQKVLQDQDQIVSLHSE